MGHHKVKADLLGPAEGVGCRHHWVIESPNGPMSRGFCKLCGAEREFPNSTPSLWHWNGEPEVPGLGGLPGVEFDEEENDS